MFAEYFDGLGCTDEGASGDGIKDENGRCGSIGIIANSIGAFYAMCALADRDIAAASDRLARADAHPLRGE